MTIKQAMDSNEQPYLFPVIFVGIWLFNSALFAVISGWWSLAQRFQVEERPEGEKVRGQVKQMGIVPENRVTHMVVSDYGLYLYASLLFRFMHPAILIPWSSIRKPRKIQRLWWTTYEYDLDSTSTIRVTSRAHEVIERYRK